MIAYSKAPLRNKNSPDSEKVNTQKTGGKFREVRYSRKKKNRYITDCLPHLQSKGIKTTKEREMRSYTRKGVMVRHRPFYQEIKLIRNLKKGGKQEKAE